MRKRKICFIPQKLFFLVVIILLGIITAQSSFGIHVFETKKEVSMQIAPDKKAFIGIDYKDRYQGFPGDQITFYIKNNLPCAATFTLDINGTPIQAFTPTQCALSTNEREEITITIGDVPGNIYDIDGRISVNHNHGKIDADFEFEIEVEEPEEPEEPAVPETVADQEKITKID